MSTPIDEDKILHFGLDYLKFLVKQENEFLEIATILSRLDDDNSNVAFFWLFGFHFSASRKGRWFIITPTQEFSASVMAWRLCGGQIEIEIHGQFFLWSEHFEFLKKFEDVPFRLLRVDICMDFKNETPYSLFCKFDTRLHFSEIKKKGGQSAETIYIGDKKSSKRKVICLYNKKLDCEVKGKTELYPEYFIDDFSVARLEIRLLSQACDSWQFSIIKLLDIEHLYFVFQKELNTSFVHFPLSPAMSWYSKPSFHRGVPDPVLRFREACANAYKKGVDIEKEALQLLGK